MWVALARKRDAPRQKRDAPAAASTLATAEPSSMQNHSKLAIVDEIVL